MPVMKTRWTDSVNALCPLNEYPRPQLVRENWLCLNGQYDYAVTGEKSDRPESFQGRITVPFAIESLLSGVGRTLMPDERLWYRRFFRIPEEYTGKRIILHFQAVDWQCDVYVNSVRAGGHTGGYCPFEFDITDLLKDGENELVVKVYDPTDKGWQQRGKQVLSSTGFWYTGTSGIWQSVWLEPVEFCHIDRLKLTPDIDSGELKVKVFTDCDCGSVLTAKVKKEDEIIFEGQISAEDSIPVPDARLWSPEDPFLYGLEVTLDCEGTKDKVESYFAMRKFSIVKDDKDIPRLALNNAPYFQRGLLDQGYWPDGGLTAPCDDALIFDISEMKRLGFNMIRKHIKVESERWYYHCDRLGIIVWQDMVSGGKALNLVYAGVLPNLNINVRDNQYRAFNRDKPEWREQFKTELFEVIDHLYNYPCIGCWVPFNEGWGQFDAKEIGQKIKFYDPSRIVDHASGWHDQNGPDLRSMHRYILPVTMPTGSKGRPFVLSEYGGYSRIIDGHVWNKAKSFGYVMFKNEEKLSKAYASLHLKQILPLIKKGLCATVYTQVSDVEFEVNGVYTYDREILKLDENTVKLMNARLRY